MAASVAVTGEEGRQPRPSEPLASRLNAACQQQQDWRRAVAQAAPRTAGEPVTSVSAAELPHGLTADLTGIRFVACGVARDASRASAKLWRC